VPLWIANTLARRASEGETVKSTEYTGLNLAGALTRRLLQKVTRQFFHNPKRRGPGRKRRLSPFWFLFLQPPPAQPLAINYTPPQDAHPDRRFSTRALRPRLNARPSGQQITANEVGEAGEINRKTTRDRGFKLRKRLKTKSVEGERIDRESYLGHK
jgi:hypothetical protein